MLKKAICLILVILITCFFSACSFNWVSVGENFGTTPSDNTETKYSYPSPVSKEDDEPLTIPEDSLPPEINLTNSMTNILGIKVAYDATQYSKDILNDDNFFATSEAIENELKTNNADLDIEEFVTNNARLLVDATYVSRVLWIHNIINQYKMLGELLITDIWANYGMGTSSWTIVGNPFWSDYNFEQAIVPTAENMNLINFMPSQTTTSITLTIEGEQKQVVFDNGIVSAGMPWKLNTLNGDLLVDTQTGLTVEEASEAEGEGEAEVEPQEVTVYAIYKTDGTIEYSLIEPERQTFELADMLDYSNYVALILMEYYSNITPALKFSGYPADVRTTDFLMYMPTWLNNNLGLGHFYDEDNMGQTIADIGQILVDNIIGEQQSQILSTYDWESILGELTKKYMDIKVVDYVDNNNIYCKATNEEGAYALFQKVLNIEYCDYTPSQFMSSNDALTIIPKENILSMVIMVKTAEQSSYFNNVILSFISEKDKLTLKTNFRYVYKGEEKVNLELDYSVVSTINIDGDGGDIDFDDVPESQDGFNGIINVKPTVGEGEETYDLSMDYLDKNSYILDSEALELQGVEMGEEGLPIQSFENNLNSNYIQHVLSIKKGHLYQFNSQTDLVNYAESGVGSDYFEFNYNLEPVIDPNNSTQVYENKMLVAILNLMVEPLVVDENEA